MEPAQRRDASGRAQATASREADVDMLSREIGKLDKQIADILAGATSVGGKKVLVSAQRAKLHSVTRQRQGYLIQRCRFALQVLATEIRSCIDIFSDDDDTVLNPQDFAPSTCGKRDATLNSYSGTVPVGGATAIYGRSSERGPQGAPPSERPARGSRPSKSCWAGEFWRREARSGTPRGGVPSLAQWLGVRPVRGRP